MKLSAYILIKEYLACEWDIYVLQEKIMSQPSVVNDFQWYQHVLHQWYFGMGFFDNNNSV